MIACDLPVLKHFNEWISFLIFKVSLAAVSGDQDVPDHSADHAVAVVSSSKSAPSFESNFHIASVQRLVSIKNISKRILINIRIEEGFV